MTKKWVKLDRELTDDDLGKRIKDGSVIVEIVSIMTSGFVFIKDERNTVYSIPNRSPNNLEIEEDDTTQVTYPSGGTVMFSSINVPLVYPKLDWAKDLIDSDDVRDWLSKHDCYLSGHSIVDTGTLSSYCRHCDKSAVWDKSACDWRMVNTDNN